jgi:hypothetical protein
VESAGYDEIVGLSSAQFKPKATRAMEPEAACPTPGRLSRLYKIAGLDTFCASGLCFWIEYPPTRSPLGVELLADTRPHIGNNHVLPLPIEVRLGTTPSSG